MGRSILDMHSIRPARVSAEIMLIVPPGFGTAFRPRPKRRLFIRNHVLGPNRTPPINPERTEIRDAAALTDEIKATVRTMGADIVGVADFDLPFRRYPDRRDNTQTLQHQR